MPSKHSIEKPQLCHSTIRISNENGGNHEAIDKPSEAGVSASGNSSAFNIELPTTNSLETVLDSSNSFGCASFTSKNSDNLNTPNDLIVSISSGVLLNDPSTSKEMSHQYSSKVAELKFADKKTTSKPAKRRQNERQDLVPKKRKVRKENLLEIKVMKTGIIHGSSENEKIPIYKTISSDRRGNVLLINNLNFTSSKTRNDADADHVNIKKLFENMGFNVVDYKNQTKKSMEKTIEEYCKKPILKIGDINITIIMYHGNSENSRTYVKSADNKDLHIEWIVSNFSNGKCEYLALKPKIFIFLSFRGTKEQTDNASRIKSSKRRLNSDVLLAYAAVSGFRYVRAFCQVFMEHVHDTSIEDLLKMVDSNIKSLKPITTRKLQKCSYENRGFKRCFLNPI